MNSKRPNDVLNLNILRDGKKIEIPVTLSLYESYVIKDIGVEIINASSDELKKFGTDHGVKISQALTDTMKRYGVEGIIITEVDNKKVNNVNDVKQILQSKSDNEDIMISFLDRSGEKKHFVFN